MAHRDGTATDRGFRPCPSCGQFVWIDGDGDVRDHDTWLPGAEGPTPCAAGRLLPAEWERRTGVVVVERTGWQGGFADKTWDTPVSRHEFLRRAMASTTKPWPDPLLDEQRPVWSRTPR